MAVQSGVAFNVWAARERTKAWLTVEEMTALLNMRNCSDTGCSRTLNGRFIEVADSGCYVEVGGMRDDDV